MHQHSTGPTMRQKIFSMNLNTETVSLYLLCCAVTDAGGSITQDSLADKWNGDRASLEREISRLEDRNIISRIDTERSALPVYRMVDEKNWR